MHSADADLSASAGSFKEAKGNLETQSIIGIHTSSTPTATRKLAKRFAACLEAGDTVILIGQLGAGKTEFVRGVAEARGLKGEVASPSFVRLHAYGGTPPLYHADFYLAKSEEDAADYGLDELSADGGVVLVEWGERFARLLPPISWKVSIEVDDTLKGRRIITISR